MTFLNPFVLLGLLAAGIPLIIHLFNFRKPRRVDFSTLAFVRELQKSTMQRVRLKQWLLLLLRTLAIAMLVLAFARPTLTGGIAAVLGGHARSSVALVLDNSASMELRDARGGYLDQARALAQAVLDQLEPGDEVHLLTTAGSAVHGTAAMNRTAAAEALADLEAGALAQPARTVLNEAAALLSASENVNREIYFISDLQSRTLGDSLDLRIPSDIALVLMPVGDRPQTNVAIEDVRVESRIVEPGSPVRLVATVRGYGSAPVSDYALSVFLGDDRVAQSPVELQPGISSEVSLVVTPQAHGWLGGRVEGEDDAFPRDNVRFFTLQVPERRRVLLVRGTGSETRYLRLALAARQSTGGSSFEVDEIAGSAFAGTLARLGEYDAVVLAGASITSSGEVDALRQYIENGGGLLVMPGGSGSPEHLNGVLQSIGAGRIDGLVGTVSGAQPVATFDRVDAEHPVFEGIFERSNQTAGVERPRVLAASRYQPASGREQTLVELTNGLPFLQEIRHGSGVAFLLTVAPEPSWSDLPVTGLFVPLVFRSLQYLSASEAVQGEDIVVGRPAELRIAGLAGGEPMRLVSPFEEESIPEQRIVPGAVLVRLSNQHRVPGIYDLFDRSTLMRRLAANLDRTESDLATREPGEVADAFRSATGAPVRVLDVRDAGFEDPAGAIRAQRSGAELWNVFLLLALGFLVSEMIVARQWRPEAVAMKDSAS